MTADPELELASARLARARRGDPDAWDELYREHESPLYTWLHHALGGDRALADDVFHDAFLRAVERIAQFDPARGSFGGWLFGIARNELRRRQRAGRAEPLLAEPGSAAPPADDRELHSAVNLTLGALSPRQHRALVLKYQEDRSLEEIAALLQTTPSAVGSLLHRARAAFRDAYPQALGEIS